MGELIHLNPSFREIVSQYSSLVIYGEISWSTSINHIFRLLVDSGSFSDMINSKSGKNETSNGINEM